MTSGFGSNWIKFGELSSESTGVLFFNLGRSKFELSSAHEKFGVWTEPYRL